MESGQSKPNQIKSDQINSGQIVEYIDKQKIICALILQVKDKKLKLLTSLNKEVYLSLNRIIHVSKSKFDNNLQKDNIINKLSEIISLREKIAENIDVKELWEVLNSEDQWFDLNTITELYFPTNSTENHSSGIIRALFKNRHYFKFKSNKFFPYTQDQVENLIAQENEEKRINKLIENSSAWIKSILCDNENQDTVDVTEAEKNECVEILKSYYLFEKDSDFYKIASQIIKKTKFENINDMIFQFFVKIGIWDEDKNIYLAKFNIPINFSNDIKKHVNEIEEFQPNAKENQLRKDLSNLEIFTIDGEKTKDFDDALSIQATEDNYILGIHISDVDYFVKKNDIIDIEAFNRGSSIYMPDLSINMLSEQLSENLCSLKKGNIRPSISIMTKLSKKFEIIDYEIFPSIIKVSNNFTYDEVDKIIKTDNKFILLNNLIKKFQQTRFNNNALQITLPEINISFDKNKNVILKKNDQKSPAREIIAELMIIANWTMAKFLAKKNIPAFFRSQQEPKKRLYSENKGSFFQNYMQRKLLSRFMITTTPQSHVGLGLDAYITATSPIRKYYDLVNQRQIKSIFNLTTPYSTEEIDQIKVRLTQPIYNVYQTQNFRHRYWVLKYLENKIGEKEEAIVLMKRKNFYVILLKNYMIECILSLSVGVKLNPEDVIRVTFQNVNPRKNTISVFYN